LLVALLVEWKNGGILNVGLAMVKKKEKKSRRRCQTLAYIRGSEIECFQHEKTPRAAKSVLNRYRKGY
jgi:hypothetical protein